MLLKDCEGKIIPENTTITLNESYKNFRILLFKYRYGLTGMSYDVFFYPYMMRLNRYNLQAYAVTEYTVDTKLFFNSTTGNIDVTGHTTGGVYIDYIFGLR